MGSEKASFFWNLFLRAGHPKPRQPILKLLNLGILLLYSATSYAQAISPDKKPTDQISDPPLIYISDFFSFLGSDGTGRVALALDANRGRDGHSWQAEHLILLLHDELQGWANLKGEGVYENHHRELKNIPDSPMFQFRDHPYRGLPFTVQTMI